MPHLSPTTLTTGEQRLILRATAGNLRDHTMISLALGTGLRLAGSTSFRLPKETPRNVTLRVWASSPRRMERER